MGVDRRARKRVPRGTVDKGGKWGKGYKESFDGRRTCAGQLDARAPDAAGARSELKLGIEVRKPARLPPKWDPSEMAGLGFRDRGRLRGREGGGGPGVWVWRARCGGRRRGVRAIVRARRDSGRQGGRGM